VRLYVPATAADLRRLEEEGRLADDGHLVAAAVTPWVLTELDTDDAEDEGAEYAVLAAAAELPLEHGAAVAVLVFDLPGTLPSGDGLMVRPGRDLPRRRLAAVHLLPGLDWYAGHELPDLVASLTWGG
jgi:hypothetical protein